MGALQFTAAVKVAKKATDDEAFQAAKDQASYESGHGGYTGTIAEKHSFIMIHRAKSAESAARIVESMMGGWGSAVPLYRPEVEEMFEDKWGPAGAIRHPLDDKTDGVVFFGWASY